MASRLTQDPTNEMVISNLAGTPQKYNSTFRGLKRLLDPPSLSEILDSESPKKAVAKMAPQALYISASKGDIELLAETLPLLTKDQWVRFIDYDGWRNEELSLLSTGKWLKLYQQIDIVEAFERFTELDEEYQVALLSPYIELIEIEAYEKLNSALQDRYTPLPCQQIFYAIKSDNPEIIELIENLIRGGLDANIEYLYSLLAHSFYLPPNEQEELIKQFRNARIEEDGFVSQEESAKIFAHIDLSKLAKTYILPPQSEALQIKSSSPSGSKLALLETTLARLNESEDGGATFEAFAEQMTFLGNRINTYFQHDPGDILALEDSMVKAAAMVNVGLEYLSQGDTQVAESAVKNEYVVTLFRVGCQLVKDLHQKFLHSLEFLSAEKYADLKKYYTRSQWPLLHKSIEGLFLETLDLQYTEFLKGVFRNIPVLPEELPTQSEGEPPRFRFEYVTNLDDLSQVAFGLETIYKELEDQPISEKSDSVTH